MRALTSLRILLLSVTLVGGCRDSAAPAAAHVGTDLPTVVTFNQDVAPILFSKCATCHRPIDSTPRPALGVQTAAVPPARPAGTRPTAEVLCVAGAPFTLLDYETAHRHASEIAAATRRRAMPPWLPESGHGEFAGERRLLDREVELIQRWVAQGAPEGEPGQRPPVPTWPGGWQLGAPDLVLSVESFTLMPGDQDVFRNFVVPVPRAETRYVRAIEFRAGSEKVLHHASVAVDPARVSRRLDRLDAGPGFTTMPADEVQNVFGWSPGKVPVMEPADTAWALEEGSDLIVQLHMIATATAETLRPEIALFFAPAPPSRVPMTIKLESKAIDIPAGDADYVVENSYVLPADVEVVSVYPHAHYLAREMRGTATLPDGTVKPLIWIRHWDVRWQDQYRYQQPLSLPKGTALSMRFTYDNSAANPNSRRRPPARVTWGPQSTDEMGALWLEVIPTDPASARLLARDYLQRAQSSDIDAAELQVRSRPADPAAHNLLAMRYIRAGRVAEARSHLDEALRLAPGDAEARSNLGTVLQMQGLLPQALVHLREAARRRPDDDRLRFNLANVLQADGRTAEAVGEYRRAIRINPDNADAHFNLAMLLGPQGRLNEAIALLLRVVDLNPRNADAYRNLAVAYQLQGRAEEAKRQLGTALRIDPDSTAARQQLAQLQSTGR